MDVKILQPRSCKFEDIKHEIARTDEMIVDIALYPNGFELKLTQTADRIIVETNRPLIQISESVYQIPD